MTHEILLRNIRIFAHHGVLPQERIVGATFILNVTLTTDFTSALLTDDLSGTVSYADVYAHIEAEMRISSATLEHVAGRIINNLFVSFPALQTITLELYKENPPIGADALLAGIRLTTTRQS